MIQNLKFSSSANSWHSNKSDHVLPFCAGNFKIAEFVFFSFSTVNTKAEVRLDITRADWLPTEVREKLMEQVLCSGYFFTIYYQVIIKEIYPSSGVFLIGVFDWCQF